MSYIVIVVYTISSNSESMHGFIFVCQPRLRRMAEFGHIDPYSYKILGTKNGYTVLEHK